jgi:DNA polymerase-3 subunit gamma/tau
MPQIGALPSLGNLGNINVNTSAQAATSTTPEDETAKQVRNSPFTQDQLNDAWAGLAEHFPGEERLNAMLSSVMPVLINPELCQITVANPWQKQEFSKYGKKVINIVRNKLDNDLLRLQVKVDSREHTRRAYTASEKYQVLVQMNPHVADLKTKLNLQLE